MTEQKGNIDPSEIGPIGFGQIALMLGRLGLVALKYALVFMAGYLACMHGVN